MIVPFEGAAPTLGQDAYVAPTATLIGDVRLGERASVWYGAVLRADQNSIVIGAGSNIQDLVTVHADADADGGRPVEVGRDVTVGHGAVLHGCRIDAGCVVGSRAVVLDGAVIGRGTLVGAGTLVPPGATLPSGVLVLGSPARVVRELTDAEREGLATPAGVYLSLARRHRASVPGGAPWPRPATGG